MEWSYHTTITWFKYMLMEWEYTLGQLFKNQSAHVYDIAGVVVGGWVSDSLRIELNPWPPFSSTMLPKPAGLRE